MDTDGGNSQLWTVPDIPVADYEVDRTHRWLQVNLSSGSPAVRAIIADRVSGRSYELDVRHWRRATGPTPSGLLVLQAQDGGRTFCVVDLGADPLKVTSTFSLPRSYAGGNTVVLGDGKKLLVDGYVVDVATGNVTRLSEGLSTVEGFSTQGGGAVAIASAESTGAGTPGAVNIWRIDTAGKVDAKYSLPASSGLVPSPRLAYPAQPSPDGRWLAWSGSFPLRVPAYSEPWPVVAMIDLNTGQVVFQAIRASTAVGPKRLSWLSDSSGILVASETNFEVLKVDGSLQPLPLGKPEDAKPIPVPDPQDVRRFLYDGQIFSAAGSPLTPVLALSTWAGRQPWGEYGLNEKASEFGFVLSFWGGKDWPPGIPSAIGLPPEVERPPFSATLRLRVKASGASVRELPGTGETVIGHLPEGSLLKVTEGASFPDRSPCNGGCSVDSDRDAPPGTAWWIHVKSDDGVEGWILSDSVTWAS